MKKKSKYEEMLEKAKAARAEREAAGEEITPAIPQDQIDALLNEAMGIINEVEVALKEPEIVEQTATVAPVKAQPKEEPVIIPDTYTRKAYNIWYSSQRKCYMIDVLEYNNGHILSFKSSVLSNSQALAMAKAKEIFSRKLIMKQEGV